MSHIDCFGISSSHVSYLTSHDWLAKVCKIPTHRDPSVLMPRYYLPMIDLYDRIQQHAVVKNGSAEGNEQLTIRTFLKSML